MEPLQIGSICLESKAQPCLFLIPLLLSSLSPSFTDRFISNRGRYLMKSQGLKRTIFTAIFVLLLGVINGCSIRQTVKPVELSGQPMEICIIKNEKVRPGFLDAYSGALKAKSVRLRTLGESASLNECTITSTYTAHWGWDLAMYMKYAEIKVYRSAALVGEAMTTRLGAAGVLINSSMPTTKYMSLSINCFRRANPVRQPRFPASGQHRLNNSRQH